MPIGMEASEASKNPSPNLEYREVRRSFIIFPSLRSAAAQPGRWLERRVGRSFLITHGLDSAGGRASEIDHLNDFASDLDQRVSIHLNPHFGLFAQLK